MVITSNQVANLSIDERLKLLEIVWESLAAEGEKLPTPDWHHEVVRERLEKFRKNPDLGQDADEFLDSLGSDE